MKIAVITPYYKEKIETLARCHESVLAQTHGNVKHVMVADGHPHHEIDCWDVTHIKSPNHNDFGDTPRIMGSISAITKGADALCFLDADNWFESNHIETLVKIHQNTKAEIVTATRNLHRIDGSLLGVCMESNGETFTDTNCYFLTRPTFDFLMTWIIKDFREAIVGDRTFWNKLLVSGHTRSHCGVPTVNYTTTFARHYQKFGEVPPVDSKVFVRVKELGYTVTMSFEDFQKIDR